MEQGRTLEHTEGTRDTSNKDEANTTENHR